MAPEQVTVAEEEYLQTLFWLQEARLPMTGANVARAMQLSPPTVQPRWSNASATAAPMPRLAPVTSTRVPGPSCTADHNSAPGRMGS